MGFEVFERPKRGRSTDGVKRVTVNQRSLRLNAAAHEALGKPKRVLLYRDGVDIGIGPAADDDERAFASMGGLINCTLFIKKAGVAPGSQLTLYFFEDFLRTDRLKE